MNQNEVILFFDGVCGLCNGLVDWLLPRDTHQRIKFATLQGTTAKQKLEASYTSDLDTVVLLYRGKLLVRSDAVLACLSEIGGVYQLAGLCKIIPRFIRDAVYKFVARNRYGWFGKRTICRMPLPGERLRFLD